MNLEKISNEISEHKEYGLYNTLGMKFISTPEQDICIATMPVDDRNIQPCGILCGGATLALIEITAGVGSLSLLEGRKTCVGSNINCSHLHPATLGQTVTATARIIHKGGRSHVWNVEVRDEAGTLISSGSVTNTIIELPSSK